MFDWSRHLRSIALGTFLAACGTALPIVSDGGGESDSDAAPPPGPPLPDAALPPAEGGPIVADARPDSDIADASISCILVQDGSVLSGCVALDIEFKATWNKVADAGCGPDAATFASTQNPSVVCCTWSEGVEAKAVKVPVSFDLAGGTFVINGHESLPLNPNSAGTLYSRAAPFPEMTEHAGAAAVSMLVLADASADGAGAFYREWVDRGGGRNGAGLTSTTSVGLDPDGGVSLLASREPHIANPGAVCPLSVAKFRWSGTSVTPSTIDRDAGRD